MQGHQPSITDFDLKRSLHLYNMLESGVRIDLEDLTMKETVLLMEWKAKIDAAKAEEVDSRG